LLFATAPLFVTSQPVAKFAGLGGSAERQKVPEGDKRQVSYRWTFVPMWLVACSLRITSICKPRSILVVQVIGFNYSLRIRIAIRNGSIICDIPTGATIRRVRRQCRAPQSTRGVREIDRLPVGVCTDVVNCVLFAYNISF